MKANFRILLSAALAALVAGCVTQSVVVESPSGSAQVEPEPVVDAHFEAVPGRGPEVIAALRAEPAPVRPSIIEGRNVLGDRRALAAQGFVHVGNSRHDVDDAQAEQKAAATATQLGVERMLVYPRHVENEGDPARYLATYYVRFKLLFGATFRNLTASERESVGGAGGVQIGAIVGSTPAAEANLMAGDLVLKFNGRAFADRVAFQELLRNEAGKPVTLTIRRNEVSMDRVVRLGALPQER